MKKYLIPENIHNFINSDYDKFWPEIYSLYPGLINKRLGYAHEMIVDFSQEQFNHYTKNYQ
jgi:hypothetical protein